jgi:hypothetical protein
MSKFSEGKPVLLSDRQVAERYDVAVRTLERWDKLPDLDFPAPVYIRRRRYREVAKLDDWDRRNAHKAATPVRPSRAYAAAQPLPRVGRGRFAKPEVRS